MVAAVVMAVVVRGDTELWSWLWLAHIGYIM